MAYTKIIKVKSNLNLCLDYTSNPKKTERRSAEDLNRLLSYTQSNDKTEHQLYVSGFNCIPQNAYEIMMETKQRWRKPVKDGNILAYHIIQSFSPGEATPDQVHQIGCEFAQRFLADRFECTVSTHLDRGHLHNHIVVNSVSYADGKMFRSDFNTYYKGIRETSDELCRENRLSVIETDGKGKSYDEWLSGQTGKPTIRGMVRKDVEQAIAAADSFDGFITELQNMGYTVKYGPRVEHMAVRHKDAQRNIRIDRLDPRFSETALREYYHKLHRMPTEMQQEYRQENAPAKPKWQPTELQPTVQRARYRGKLPRRYPKVSGFMACYYHYCALLRKAYHGKATKRCYFLLREDFLLFSRYQQQTKFLWENHIETMDELLAYKENAEVQIQQLARQRKVLYRQKREPERAAREEKIKSLTQQMKALRHEVYICSDIETDAAEVQEKLRQADVALPKNFKNILAVCRSRNISCDIILQNIAQLKSLFKDDWEGIIGNCDTLLYLGGNEYGTYEYLSKILGKETERTKSQSIGKGSRGSSSDSLQTAGRELCMPDEIRRMRDDECLLLMRSEDPVIDKKYNLLHHPNVKYTPDAGGEPYVMPPDYMGDAVTITMDAVAAATAPEITEEMYEQLDYLEKHPEENYYENEENFSQYDQGD